jgi:predicted DCC family thiol-disulfide oxidoreductase YuxK
MKKNNNTKAIIYDDNCPMCKAYTSAFVKGGFLTAENRISFTEVNMQQFKIDWQKAKHEIPLVDLKTGEIKYGVDALAEILQQKIFFIKPILKIKAIEWFFKKLYKLISYNRKIIVANTKLFAGNFDCTPDYSFLYRWILITVCFLLINIFTLTSITNLAIHFTFTQLLTVNTIIVCTSVCSLLFFNKKRSTEIIAHSFLSMLIFSFLLFIASFIKIVVQINTLTFYVLFAAIASLFIKQMIQRCKYIKQTT